MKFQNILNREITQCTVCPRMCRLGLGQTGFCWSRMNVDGDIKSIVYGKTTGLAIDPIEKKPLYHFLPGSRSLSFGTAGCNMGCIFCQNYHMTKCAIDLDLMKDAHPRDIAIAAVENNCQSVSFTYNDPVVFLEYAVDTAKICHDLGIKTVAVTAGYINPEPRAYFFKHMDAANIDLKGIRPEFYKKFCAAKIEYALDTIKYVRHNTACHLELTNLLIPGENDSEADIRDLVDWVLKNVGDLTPLHFSAFYPCYKLQNKPRTAFETLVAARNIAKEMGMKHVYVGNVSDTETNSTYCAKCGALLIKRSGFNCVEINLDKEERCKSCKTGFNGVFTA